LGGPEGGFGERSREFGGGWDDLRICLLLSVLRICAWEIDKDVEEVRLRGKYVVSGTGDPALPKMQE